MSYIKYSLLNVSRLDTMAATGVGVMNSGYHNVNVATGGFYLILNERTDNRYVGKAGNLKKRFDGRMAAVNELGLRTGDLARTDAFFGTVAAYNSGVPVLVVPPGGHMKPPYGGINGLGPAPARAAENPALACPAPNYAAYQVTTTVDGQTINVEAVLIRFFKKIGVGGTMTNLQHMGRFTNPTNTQMDVMVEWGAGITTNLAAGYWELQVPGNTSF